MTTLPLTSVSLTPTYCVLCVCLRILMSYCVLCVCLRILMSYCVLCVCLPILMSYCVLCVCLRILMSTILLLLIFLVFYVLFFVLFVFVLCRMCLLLPISLDCPFLMSIAGFSNVYLAYYNSSNWANRYIRHCVNDSKYMLYNEMMAFLVTM
jgi:hypothetical protein